MRENSRKKRGFQFICSVLLLSLQVLTLIFSISIKTTYSISSVAIEMAPQTHCKRKTNTADLFCKLSHLVYFSDEQKKYQAEV